MTPKNVICLVVDRLQAGMLGPYGNTWVRTLHVDRLAAQSFVFDQAIACNPSLAAVLDDLWPAEFFGNRPATLITDDPAVNSHPSAALFAEKRLIEPASEFLEASDIATTQLAEFFRQSVEWLGGRQDPFCLFLHTRGMAGPWDAPWALREQYADEEDPRPPEFVVPPEHFLAPGYDPDELLGIQHAYAGQVSVFDTCLGVLLDALEESPFAASTLFVLVGARGFPLGEHLRVGPCDAALYNELVHVPLLVRSPGDVGALARSQALVTHRDLPPLLTDWLELTVEGSPSPAPRLSSHIRGEPNVGRDHLRFSSNLDRAIRTPAWYLRESGEGSTVKHELYVKPDDHWEVNDIADRCPEIATQLADVLANPGLRNPLPDALVEEWC